MANSMKLRIVVAIGVLGTLRCVGTGTTGGGPTISGSSDIAKDGTVNASGADGTTPDGADATVHGDSSTPDGAADATPTTQTDTTASDAGADATATDTATGGCQTAADCDDNDYCTADNCKPDGGCDHGGIAGCVAPLAPCNQQNPCKVGICDVATNGCVACLQTTDCQAGQVCQNKQCKPAQKCKSDIDCKALKLVCGKAGGLCVDCNNALDCAAGEQCTDSKCVGAAPCKSSKDCPAVCNQPKGICVECVSVDDCGPGKFCSYDGHCNQAVCLGSSCGSAQWQFACKPDGSAYLAGKTCDDTSACTNASCSNSKGCLQLPADGPCDDGNACTQSDACLDYVCTGKPMVCTDANPCTDDLCNKSGACQFISNTAKCDDNSNCTQNDTCSGGACKGQGVNCDDGDPCTTDDCDSTQACLHLANSNPCTDGNACTDADACAAGKCVSGAAKSCDDGNSCTTDACDPKVGCKFIASGTGACDDGNKCTFNDTCTAGGQCLGGAGKCEDANTCTDDTCDPKMGCLFPANNLPCDDKNPCTGSDKCGNGQCQPGTGAACDDGNPCTDQGCDVAKGGCFFMGNTAACEDGNACTSGDKCSNGKCATGSTLVCDDKSACTTDSCDATKGCVYAVKPLCDDKDPCTIDSCDATSGACSHTTIDKCCATGSVAFFANFEFGSAAALAFSNSSGLAKKGWQVWDPAKYATSGTAALYYGDPALQNYNFNQSTGTAKLDIGSLPPAGKQRIEFQLYFAVEKYLTYDKLDVTLSAGGKADLSVWTKASLGTYSCNSGTSTYTCVTMPAGWTTVKFDIPAGYTTDVKLTFKFDSVDNNYNETLGVLVDDVKIVQVSCN